MNHRSWIAFSGVLWLAVGIFLLYKGLHFIAEGADQASSLSFRFQRFFGTPQQAGTVLIAFGLLLGFFKGRFILSKTVGRTVSRIGALSLPIRPSDVYAPSYWLLISSMIALGMLLRFLPLPIDARGLIDVAIGTALIQGALLYFRAAKNFRSLA